MKETKNLIPSENLENLVKYGNKQKETSIDRTKQSHQKIESNQTQSKVPLVEIGDKDNELVTLT